MGFDGEDDGGGDDDKLFRGDWATVEVEAKDDDNEDSRRGGRGDVEKARRATTTTTKAHGAVGAAMSTVARRALR